MRYGCSAQTLRNIFDNKHGYGTFVTFINKAHWLGGWLDNSSFHRNDFLNIKVEYIKNLYNKINKEVRYVVHRKNKKVCTNLKWI